MTKRIVNPGRGIILPFVNMLNGVLTEVAGSFQPETSKPAEVVNEVIPAVDNLPPEEFRLGPATWRNQENDTPVIVTGYLGKGQDGRDYVKVEGSATGHPLDEIQYSTVEVESSQSKSSELESKGELADILAEKKLDPNYFDDISEITFGNYKTGAKAKYISEVAHLFNIEGDISKTKFEVLSKERDENGDLILQLKNNGDEIMVSLTDLLKKGVLKLPKSARKK